MLHVICDSPQHCPRLSRLDSACTAFKSSGAGPGCNGRWPFDSVIKQGCCHEKKCLGTSGVLLYGAATGRLATGMQQAAVFFQAQSRIQCKAQASASYKLVRYCIVLYSIVDLAFKACFLSVRLLHLWRCKSWR